MSSVSVNPQIPKADLEALATERGVSKAELETVSLALDGLSSQEISHKLGITAIAVRKRLGEVYQKFGISGSRSGKLAELKQILTSGYPTHSTIASPRQDWGEAPDVSIFYGRTEELATLEQWIVNDKCRLVGLFGMPGIGKTALCAKLAQQIQDEFDYVIWRSLSHAPSFPSLLAELLQFLSNQQEINIPEDVNRGISQLVDYLTKNRCLLILDGVEAILRSGNERGEYEKGYEKYGVLWRRVAEKSHKSCLLLISREKPKEIRLLERPKLPEDQTPFLCSLQLIGLKLEDARRILQEKGLTGEDKWELLINYYQSNPLLLKIVSMHIEELFQGNVFEFLDAYKPLKTLTFMGEYESILNDYFKKFSDLEKQILRYIAIENNAVSLAQIKNNLPESFSISDVMLALSNLICRSWVETATRQNNDINETIYILQKIIKTYVKKLR